MSIFRRLFFEAFYFRRPPWDTGVSPPELLEFIEATPPGRALDLGCGTGTNAITLAQHGWQVVGVDFAHRAIQAARRKAQEAGVTVDFRAGDVTRQRDLDGPFDLILDIGCFHSLPDDRKLVYLDNLGRWLAPGGTYLLYAFFKQSKEGRSGLEPRHVGMLTRRLSLVKRQDGMDRGQRPSTWFTFRNPND